jgi:hypothetical protein
VRQPSCQPVAGLRVLESIVALQLSAGMHSVNKLQHLTAEDLSHDIGREKVLDAGWAPRIRVVEHTGGHDRVHVRMKAEISGPGVQDH